MKLRSFLAPLLLLGLSLCGAALLLTAWRLPAEMQRHLDDAYRRESTTAQQLAGVVAANAPELLPELAAVLLQADPARQAAGAQALAPYGYPTTSRLVENAAYQQIYESWRQQGLIFAGCGLGSLLFYALWLEARKAGRDQRLAGILLAYQAEDFSFASSLETLGGKHRLGSLNRLGDLLKQLGSQIYLHKQRLIEEKEATKALVTDISHQLKTPLASFQTCFELFVEAESAAERAEFLERSQQQLAKLQALTDVLMQISRLESAMIEISPQPSSLNAIILDAVNGVYGQALHKQISIELEPFPDLTLTLDQKWTAEAIRNVLDNAVKYNPEGSSIHLRVEKRVSFARLEIEDQGSGIPKAERPRIFQRFYRGSSPLVKRTEGSGVGLYLSRSILERQNGNIFVSGAVQGGSTFVLQLPLGKL